LRATFLGRPAPLVFPQSRHHWHCLCAGVRALLHRLAAPRPFAASGAVEVRISSEGAPGRFTGGTGRHHRSKSALVQSPLLLPRGYSGHSWRRGRKTTGNCPRPEPAHVTARMCVPRTDVRAGPRARGVVRRVPRRPHPPFDCRGAHKVSQTFQPWWGCRSLPPRDAGSDTAAARAPLFPVSSGVSDVMTRTCLGVIPPVSARMRCPGVRAFIWTPLCVGAILRCAHGMGRPEHFFELNFVQTSRRRRRWRH
jgi:hypothetical protein